jgi:hypothetical protein
MKNYKIKYRDNNFNEDFETQIPAQSKKEAIEDFEALFDNCKILEITGGL